VDPRARLARATVMFADVVGFTALSESLGAERAYFAVMGAMRVVDGVARRHGGAVDKYLGDSLMIVFGYPMPSPAPASEAASAAIEMRAEFDEYRRDLDVGLGLVIGINTGSMVAGDVRGQVAREFHVLGDAVNVAARLKAKAPHGHIYVGPETENESRSGFDYAPLGRMPLKGKEADVAIFDLVAPKGARAEVATSYPFVGRGAEIDRVMTQVHELHTGKGHTLLVVGAEGVGKSRLLAEIATRAATAGIGIIQTAALAGDRRGEGRLLERLLAACSGGTHAAGTGTTEALAERIVEAVERQVAVRPLVLVVDDVHRADPPSLARLPMIAARLAERPVLWVLASRREPADTLATLRDALDPATTDEMQLAPLSPDESHALIDAVAGAPLSEDSRQLILAHGDGHPLHLIRGVFLEPALRAERERAGEGHRAGETERRRATILFADITGFTALTERAGAERAYPVVVGCLRLLDEIARKHGGTVEKYLGDCVMALFGVGVAIEDAPRAAVNAAIEMRREVRAYSESLGSDMRLDVHSGINTGLGIAGDISGDLVSEFAVMGDPVSMADALTDLAPAGEVYVGAEVWRATREVFDYAEVEAGAALGTFALRSQHEQLHRARIGVGRRVFSGLVGRDRELTSLRDGLRSLHAGTGGIVSVVAAAGLGKSRLLAELTTSEEARGLTWCEGRSLATGRLRSFHAIVDLCRSLAGIEEHDDDTVALGKLRATVDRVLPEEREDVLPILAKLLNLELTAAERARLDELQGDAMEKLTLRSVTQLVRAVSTQQPVVVVMDDLHWADVSSIELLESLLRLSEDRPILFINLCRPGYPSTSDRVREQARTRYAERSSEIELRPLDAKAARGMLNNLFRRGDLPSATRQLIEEKAQGNPFYIEEVVRSLVDEGAAEQVDGLFRATDKIQTVTIPGSIQELVMARVDALDASKRQVLQAAAVIGGRFPVEVLARVVENVARLADEIDALLHAEFLTRAEWLHGRQYEFKHPLIQEVTYEGLLQSRREEQHRKVAESMEEVLPEDLPGYVGMLAYHYGKGGVAERAESFLFRAGAEAARAAAPSEALHFFEEASKLYLEIHAGGGDPEKRALLEKSIAQALYYRGRFLDAVEHFNTALRFLGDRVLDGGVRLWAHFALNLTTVLARVYGPRLGRRHPQATTRQREIMELRYARAEATVTAQPTRHLFDSMDTLAFLQRVDPASVPGAGKFYAGAAALFAFGGLSFDVSRRFSQQAHALVPSTSDDEHVDERAMNFAGRVLEGDWADEHEIEPARITASVRNGRIWGPTTYLGLLGEKRLHCGDLAGARACVEEIDWIWDQFNYDLAKTNHYYLLTLLALEEGALARAVEAADEYYEENPEDVLHILALGAKAKAQTLLGALDSAEETLHHAAEIVARSWPVAPFHGGAYDRSRLLLDLARLEDAVRSSDTAARRTWQRRARKSVRAALGTASKVAWRRAEVLRLAGRYHWLLGRRRKALRVLARGVDWGEALGVRPETARVWAEAGRLLAWNGRPVDRFRDLDSNACTARAREAFTELGMTWDLEQLGG